VAIRVEVVVARPEGAQIVPLSLPPGSRVADALAACGISAGAVGVFGRRVAADAPLNDGDRVEVYRVLKADPKEARRRRARRR
jgi:putative ubiquitin-RnfH superfamily antitoxin RatB of RatAB toxin-antitoxin module